MRCVRCFRPLTSERSINNGMQGNTCRKYINTMSPSSRVEMYQAFQGKMERYGEQSQCHNLDYSFLSKKGNYVITTSIYDQDENELIVSYQHKTTGEMTSIRFHAEEGKPMYDYEKGEAVHNNVEIGSAQHEEITRQEDSPAVDFIAQDYVGIQSGDTRRVDLRQDATDLYQQYKFYEDSEGVKIQHVNYSPSDKSYSLSFTQGENPVKVTVYAKKGKSMGVTPVRFRMELNGEPFEGTASDNDSQWSAIRKEYPVINRLHFDARDSINNEVDMAFTKHKVKWLQSKHPDKSIDKTKQYRGLERDVNVKLAYTHPETKESVIIMDTAEGQEVIRLYKKENPLPDERPYCFAVHKNGTVEEGKLGDSYLRYYQEQSKTVNSFVKNYQFQAD